MSAQTLQCKVAINCLVFNHEPYLRDCLEGFVMQQTNFPFVAIVHDDASTDNSAAIIREYEEKYPDIIKPIYETENQYSKPDGSLGRIMNAAIDATGAKYVAMCEGDDYWTDPLKLQKQVDILESHPDYSMCFHAAKISLEGVDASITGAMCERLVTREYFANDMFASWIVPTASIVYRKKMLDAFSLRHSEWLTRGDIALVLRCSHVGRVWGMEEQMSVYRMQPSSVSHNPAIRGKEIFKLPNHFRCLYINFPELNKEDITWCISNAYYGRMKRQKNPLKFIQDFMLFVRWNPEYAWNKIKQLLKRNKAK